MAHVDFLSRNPVCLKNKSVLNKIEEKLIDLSEISESRILVEQEKDPELLEILTKLKKDDLPLALVATDEIRSNVLHRKIQRNSRTGCLPVALRTFRLSVMNQVHESIMHLGWEKTLDKVYD